MSAQCTNFFAAAIAVDAGGNDEIYRLPAAKFDQARLARGEAGHFYWWDNDTLVYFLLLLAAEAGEI